MKQYQNAGVNKVEVSSEFTASEVKVDRDHLFHYASEGYLTGYQRVWKQFTDQFPAKI